VCNDGNACTPNDTCDADGVCSGPELVCPAIDPCTPGACAGGICNSTSNCPGGAGSLDLNANCTYGCQCASGLCQAASNKCKSSGTGTQFCPS
jgi:hypothetical protein